MPTKGQKITDKFTGDTIEIIETSSDDRRCFLFVWILNHVDGAEQNVWHCTKAPLYSACGGEREGDRAERVAVE